MLTTLLSFAFVLGVLIFVHELGHFVTAKMVGIKVERFSLGFPPRAFGFQYGDTDYCISWLPLGGYVKMAGMIDESLDETVTGAPWEYASKPVWQRIIVISAGSIMNFILAIAIYSTIIYYTGIFGTTIGEVIEGMPGQSIGIRPNDVITSVAGTPVDSWSELTSIIHANPNREIDIEWKRGKELFSAKVTPDINEENGVGQIGIGGKTLGALVNDTLPDTPAASIGLEPGDMITEIDGKQIKSARDLIKIVNANAGNELVIRWQRSGEEYESIVTPALDSVSNVGLIGITVGTKVLYRDAGILESVQGGFTISYDIAKTTADTLKSIIAGEKSLKDHIGGPVIIAEYAGKSARSGFQTLLGFMAFISLNLAFFNLLPFPVLDGGHLVMLLIEGVMRKPLPIKARIIIQKVGMVFLLALMVFILINDISRLN